jgi:hypothetical protein
LVVEYAPNKTTRYQSSHIYLFKKLKRPKLTNVLKQPSKKKKF